MEHLMIFYIYEIIYFSIRVFLNYKKDIYFEVENFLKKNFFKIFCIFVGIIGILQYNPFYIIWVILGFVLILHLNKEQKEPF